MLTGTRLAHGLVAIASNGVASLSVEFNELVDWLAEREGTEVAVEAGIRDPTVPGGRLHPVNLHATLGKLRPGDDVDHLRGLTVVPLGSGDRDRLFIDPRRITSIQGDDSAVSVWFHDSMYLSFVG